MTPRCEVIGECRLWLADAFTVLPTLPPCDFVLTDPPFDRVTHTGARGGNGTTQLIPFAPLDIPTYLHLCELCVTLSSGWVLMTCDWRHAALLETSGLPLIRLGVWVKPNGAPQFTGDRPGTGWEAIAILNKQKPLRWNGGGRHAVWVHSIEQGSHPTQKPLSLIKEWVRLFSQPGDIVCDPFFGSGTTAIACIGAGRRFVGCEISEKYHTIACRRIEAAYRQPDLFLPRASASAPTQPTLFAPGGATL